MPAYYDYNEIWVQNPKHMDRGPELMSLLQTQQSGRDDVDTLFSIENYQFSDGTFTRAQCYRHRQGWDIVSVL